MSNPKIYVSLSGKGGVGKTTVAALIALALGKRGKKVLLMDNDIDGPNIQRILKSETPRDLTWEAQLYARPWRDNVFWFSPSILLPSTDTPIGNAWKPGKKAELVAQILREVQIPDVDVLVVDTPPGLSEELKYWVERGIDGAFLISQPTSLAIEDVQKSVTFCEEEGIRVIGLISNMESFICESCRHTNYPLGQGKVKALAEKRGVRFLGTIPMDRRIEEDIENGVEYITPILDNAGLGLSDEFKHRAGQVVQDIKDLFRLNRGYGGT